MAFLYVPLVGDGSKRLTPETEQMSFCCPGSQLQAVAIKRVTEKIEITITND